MNLFMIVMYSYLPPWASPYGFITALLFRGLRHGCGRLL